MAQIRPANQIIRCLLDPMRLILLTLLSKYHNHNSDDGSEDEDDEDCKDTSAIGRDLIYVLQYNLLTMRRHHHFFRLRARADAMAVVISSFALTTSSVTCSP